MLSVVSIIETVNMNFTFMSGEVYLWRGDVGGNSLVVTCVFSKQLFFGSGREVLIKAIRI